MGPSTASNSAARASVVVGVVVLLTKTIAWRLTGSVALLGDAVESIVNVVAAGLVVWALHFSSQPADDEHPWGHGKAEYFSAGVEGTLVVLAGLAIAYEAALALTGNARPPVLGVGLAVSVAATAMNLALGLWLAKVARENDSAAVRADSKHVLADVVTTGGSLVGLFVAKVTDRLWMDPVIAIAVAVHLLGEGVGVVRGAASALLDEALRPEELATLTRILRGAILPSESFHGVRTRRAGARVFIEIHLVVDGTLTVHESHARCDTLEVAVARALPGAELTVHVEPDVAPHQSPAQR